MGQCYACDAVSDVCLLYSVPAAAAEKAAICCAVAKTGEV